MPADAPTFASKGSLLIVDDEPSIAKYMGLVLGREGFEVLTAYNAEGGWEPFQRQVPPVRAVVTDWAMPGEWNGLELARRVQEASPTTPVLLVSGHEPSGPLDACSGLLPKPFTADLLRAAVRRMIEPAVGCN